MLCMGVVCDVCVAATTARMYRRKLYVLHVLRISTFTHCLSGRCHLCGLCNHHPNSTARRCRFPRPGQKTAEIEARGGNVCNVGQRLDQRRASAGKALRQRWPIKAGGYGVGMLDMPLVARQYTWYYVLGFVSSHRVILSSRRRNCMCVLDGTNVHMHLGQWDYRV